MIPLLFERLMPIEKVHVGLTSSKASAPLARKETLLLLRPHKLIVVCCYLASFLILWVFVSIRPCFIPAPVVSTQCNENLSSLTDSTCSAGSSSRHPGHTSAYSIAAGQWLATLADLAGTGDNHTLEYFDALSSFA